MFSKWPFIHHRNCKVVPTLLSNDCMFTALYARRQGRGAVVAAWDVNDPNENDPPTRWFTWEGGVHREWVRDWPSQHIHQLHWAENWNGNLDLEQPLLSLNGAASFIMRGGLMLFTRKLNKRLGSPSCSLVDGVLRGLHHCATSCPTCLSFYFFLGKINNKHNIYRNWGESSYWRKKADERRGVRHRCEAIGGPMGGSAACSTVFTAVDASSHPPRMSPGFPLGSEASPPHSPEASSEANWHLGVPRSVWLWMYVPCHGQTSHPAHTTPDPVLDKWLIAERMESQRRCET